MGIKSVTNEKGWTWIFRKGKSSHERPIENPFNKELEKVASSLYVTNFPDSLDARGLWKICEPYGRIVDAYIARKSSKMGKRFGFVSYHLFAAVARFQRAGTKHVSKNVDVENKHVSRTKKDQANVEIHNMGFQPQKGMHSYASVAQGGSKLSVQNYSGSKTVTLHESDLIKVEDTTKVVLVKVKDVETMANMHNICKTEGFTELKIHHVGGLWMWIEFSNAEACLAFKNNSNMMRMFASIKPVSKNFIVDERMIWVEANGLPLCAWVLWHSRKWLVSLGECFVAHVRELATWSIHIEDEKDEEDSVGNNEDFNDISGYEDSIVEEKVLETDFGSEQVGKEESTMEGDESRSLDDVHSGMNQNAQNDETVEPKSDTDGSCPLGFEHTMEPKSDTNGSRPPGFEHTVEPKSDTDGSCPPGFEHLKMSSLQKQATSIFKTSTRKRKKRTWIKDLCFRYNIQFLGVQETKMTRLELFRLKSMWGNYSFDYACSMARGHSGGLVSIWDPAVFVKQSIWSEDNFLIVQGKWVNHDDVYFMVNIYGPHDPASKQNLWHNLLTFIQHHSGKYVLFGDLNEVRDESERFGSTFSRGEAQIFNDFIHDSCLVDMPMGGRMFTWMNKFGTKMSKLDRFLLSESVIGDHVDLTATVLERLWSDHNPILLHIQKADYASGIRLQDKLKFIKHRIKDWNLETRSNDRSRKHDVVSRLNMIDTKIDTDSATEAEREERVRSLQECDEIDRTCRLCITTKQKSYINEEVNVMINGETFEVHVRELSNWSVKIVDDIESGSEDERSEEENLDTNSELDASVDHVNTPNDVPDVLENNESPNTASEELKTKVETQETFKTTNEENQQSMKQQPDMEQRECGFSSSDDTYPPI
ncbi:RNA-directed DNA polymerase, eukaryota, Reverse transcriptase zinc-binding domain protein [Artemisia annua]|uniref:RNA-directed DNA polymerase, eukaryota, Reverse transcriptase zinc-binding domain protein n=1 Tax=Artemisia annua TaxID=35608 RepID=A0A2U1QMS0_ARTAN|nr:RNA-directed DNA polymerase, eukaryota, Reverse transcriptase zinc-binding domain protein [Artemisia annua]